MENTAAQPYRPLAGIRVLELCHVIAGPMCAYQFALLGAEVLKVESPDGPDMFRSLGTDLELAEKNMGTVFMGHASNKKGVALNLKDKRGLDALKKLIATADVLIHNYRPGVTERLGIGYEHCKALNPRLVYCAISGFGQDGPYRDRPTMDHVIQGESGIMAITGMRDGPRVRPGYAAIDTATGFVAASAAMGALVGALRTGRGCYIDVSMLETAVLAQGPVYYEYLNTGDIQEPVGSASTAKRGAGGTFRTSDGKDIVVSAVSADQVANMARTLGRPEIIDDPRFGEEQARSGNIENAEALRAIMAEAISTDTAANWEKKLLAAGVPVGSLKTIPEVAEHPQLLARQTFKHFDNPPGIGRRYTVQGAPYHLEGAPVHPTTPPPRLGEHTAAVLRELGYSDAEVKALFDAGVAHSSA
jgi:crotonobetainyl-CoA:carnitine CoA-transferase CaiB-like acyl-CoA transferase